MNSAYYDNAAVDRFADRKAKAASNKKGVKNAKRKNVANARKTRETPVCASRFSASYWMHRVFRPCYTDNGQYHQVSEFFVRIQHANRREAVALGTNNQELAAGYAATLYQNIRIKGWDAALREISPERSNPTSRVTVGDHIATVLPLLRIGDVSRHKYAYCLRRIAMDIADKNTENSDKFNPAVKAWRATADKLKLSILTPVAIEKWKLEFLENGGSSPLERIAARRNVNYFLRNARSLFGKKVQKKCRELGLRSIENPFAGVDLERQGNTRYVSNIDSAELLQKAKKDLRTNDLDAWKVVLCAFGAGMRRAEIDVLQLSQLNAAKGTIRIENNEFFETKSEDSVGTINVDPYVIDELRRSLESEKGFVVEPGTPPANGKRAPGYYRCAKAFKRVISWLRENGVDSERPIHVLRKEFGSIINAEADIYTASSQLRHASISTTAAFYTDNRKRTVVNVCTLIKGRSRTKSRMQKPAKR